MGKFAEIQGDEQLGVLGRDRVVGIGERIVAEQVAQRDYGIDVGIGAAVPDEENVAVADLEQFALEFPDQAIELARRYAQVVVPPVTRLQAGQVEMYDSPIVIVALQLAHEGEQLGLHLVVLGCLHDRLEGRSPELGGGAHVRHATRMVIGRS